MKAVHCDRCMKIIDITDDNDPKRSITLGELNNKLYNDITIDLCPTCWDGLIMYLCRHKEPMSHDLSDFCATQIANKVNGKQIEISDIVAEIENENKNEDDKLSGRYTWGS